MIKNLSNIGGRGAFDISSQCIPLERRQYHQIGSHNGIKIIEGITINNAKTPVMSNTANTAYAIWSQNANRITSILFYRNHILYKQIDVDASNSH